MIGLFHERNVVRMWAAISLGGVLCDIPKMAAEETKSHKDSEPLNMWIWINIESGLDFLILTSI